MAEIDREEIAQRHGLPDGYGSRLTGETREANEAIAAAIAALEIRANTPAEKPNAAEIQALGQLDRKASRISATELLGIEPRERR